jgi:hypothetical protein
MGRFVRVSAEFLLQFLTGFLGLERVVDGCRDLVIVLILTQLAPKRRGVVDAFGDASRSNFST